jgi:GT2 family glycosyltransferase
VNLAICSAFNNSIRRGDLWRYMAQVEALRVDGATRVYAVEGDSTDGTYAALHDWAWTERVLKLDFGHPVKGSVTDPDRLLQVSIIASVARAAALADGWADWILWVESDLIWGPDLVERLYGRLAGAGDMIAPWIAIQGHGNGTTDLAELEAWPKDDVIFYDIWAFRKLPDGREHYGPFSPPPDGEVEVYSAGSCLLASADLVRVTNGIGPEAIVSWCKQGRAQGYTVWCDGRTRVWHWCPTKG